MARKLLVTPKGVAVYPRLAGKPDTKFNPEGVWKVGLALEGEDASTLKASIDAAHQKSVLDAKKENTGKKSIKVADAPYREEEDSDRLIFNFKMKASGISKKTKEPWTMQPALFDAAGKPLPNTVKIGGGSVVRVSYELSPFYVPALGAGVSLRLAAVQIIELVEWGGNAKSFGFDVEADPEAGTETKATDDESGAGEDSDEF